MFSILTKFWKSLEQVLYPALQIQIIPMLGYLLSLAVSLFYLGVNDNRFPIENPWIVGTGLAISCGLWLLGTILSKRQSVNKKLNLVQGAWVVFFTWFFACSVSSLVFIMSGFPVPADATSFSLGSRFVDGFFESMSGFTTTGSSILPSVEVFSRSVLFWRSLTHWIGGMGIAFMAITIFKHFRTRRSEIINSEAESPHIINFSDEDTARKSGFEFLKAYLVISMACLILLVGSGQFFREKPYETWYDNVYDSTTIMFGTIGTGGFSIYNSGIGLPIEEDGKTVIGGLRNPVSEWILAFFMFFSAMNFALWYVLIFKGDFKSMLRNKELRIFTYFVGITTLLITAFLVVYNFHPNVWEALRYAFFNVTTIISTTGFANDDFDGWPLAAQGVLFACYLVGACVGSTGGGIKFTRFLVLFQYMGTQLKNLIYGGTKSNLIIDGVSYNERSSGLIITNIVIYFMLFLFGAILIMITGSKVIFTDGTIRDLDFVSAFTASIANLGNIGPAIVNGSTGSGPTGNFSAYSEVAKIIMIILMFIGRVGVLTCIMLFVSKGAAERMNEARSHVDFDGDAPIVFGR